MPGLWDPVLYLNEGPLSLVTRGGLPGVRAEPSVNAKVALMSGEGLEFIVGQRDEVDLVRDVPQDLVDADGERNKLAVGQVCSKKDKDRSEP